MDDKGFTIKDFFFFKKMYTPVFITLFYWLCLFCIVLVGIGILFSSFQSFEMSFGAGLFGIFSGIIFILTNIILARLGFELISILFKINSNLEKLVSSHSSISNLDNKTDQDSV